ncbi:hypothetical protein PS858_00001 [Pseudomonas fluorescens]|nr:hypothetical protein PS858_00001 [Pseudomonas fluorescens]
MFQRRESVLNNEIESFGSPREAVLEFSSAVSACNNMATLNEGSSRLIARWSLKAGKFRPSI